MVKEETVAEAAPAGEKAPVAEEAKAPAPKPAPAKTAEPVSTATVEKVKPVGRAANDPRIAPQPVQNLQITTAKPTPPVLDAAIMALPDPSRPKLPRAVNDPRN